MTEHRISQHRDAEGRKCWKIEARHEATGLWEVESSPQAVYYSKYAAKKALRWMEGQAEDLDEPKEEVNP